MSVLPLVSELTTEPIVGRMYRVPILPVRHRTNSWIPRNRILSIPVFGEIHADAEIIHVPERHWHIDFRFLTETQSLFLGMFHSFKELIENGRLFGKIIYQTEAAGEIAIRRRKCLRAMPWHTGKYEPFGSSDHVNRPVPWLRPLEQAHQSCQVQVSREGRRVCPHKGLPLNGLPTDTDGSVTCPGHGLCWNADGSLKPRFSRE